MSIEKQIEEIAHDICGYCNVGGVCILDGKKCDLKCTHRDIAEIIYTAGYRKQSEVAREIFEEVESLTIRYLNDVDYSGGDMIYDLNELKKKYTEVERGVK